VHQFFSDFAGLIRLLRLVRTRRLIPDLTTGLPMTKQAVAYAERAHSGQRRQADGAPFIEHPLEVVALLHYAGAHDDVIAAGALHDTIEKTKTQVSDLHGDFGSRIAELVQAVSDDDNIADYHERKAAAREQAAAAGDEALMILAADKISKVRELRTEILAARRRRDAIATASRARRAFHYHECLHLLEQHLADSPLSARLHAEIELLPEVLSPHVSLAGAAR
jgi:(p)ppGpp synthase/HD superfamily hydrolase